MITDLLDELITPYLEGGRAKAIGLDYQAVMVAAPIGDSTMAVLAQFIFSANSPILGQRMWTATPPMTADQALNPHVVKHLVEGICGHFEGARAEVLNAQRNGGLQ